MGIEYYDMSGGVDDIYILTFTFLRIWILVSLQFEDTKNLTKKTHSMSSGSRVVNLVDKDHFKAAIHMQASVIAIHIFLKSFLTFHISLNFN